MDFDTRAVHHAINVALDMLDAGHEDTACDILRMLARRMVDGTLKVTLDGLIELRKIP